MAYKEEDLLALSGIQHIAFCPRQWALIHIENQWQENVLTLEGRFIHERADDPYVVEKRKDLIVSRAVNIASYKLGLYGVADVVEFWQTESSVNAVTVPKRRGNWRPRVVEYKRGKPKYMDCDKVQLCAQALCLEEMHGIRLEEGDIFYNAIKHRENVKFSESLRQKTKALALQMHNFFKAGITPPPVIGKACKSCSLKEICMPELGGMKASVYLHANLK